MRLKIGVIDHYDNLRQRLGELKHSDSFEICGVVCRQQHWQDAKLKFYTDTPSLIASSSPDVLAICANPSECVQICKDSFMLVPKVIISKAFDLSLPQLEQIISLKAAQNIYAIADMPQRYHPVVLSLKKALKKQNKIYAIYICLAGKDRGGFSSLLTQNIDLANYLCDFKASQSQKAGLIALDLAQNLQMLLNNSVMLNIQICASSLAWHFIKVMTDEGVFYADLIQNKLFMLSEYGQINLKVEVDKSAHREQYKAIYSALSSNETGGFCDLKELRDIKELL